MIFSSLVFLCVFLPAVFILYYIIPSLKAKNILLIAASLIFYSYGEPVYVLLMIFSSLINWGCALLIDRSGGSRKKLLLAAAVIVNLGMLGVFKYADFAVSNLNAVLGLDIREPGLALPIGISFFTFQALSYVIDVYRDDAKAQKNYLNILLYISFFPQLIAGPIVKFHDISLEISSRRADSEEIAAGLCRFIVGLAKKLLIANTVGLAADTVFAYDIASVNVLSAWLGALSYLLQIYYDFSGYSDMAIGLGKMFGFHFKENFNYPYASTSVKEFWRRWHISMSTWFREYLYIPLGGNRKGRKRACLNKLIVFFCTGLWHGASWTFVIWGLFHGLFLLAEEYIPFLKKLPKAIGHIYTLLVVTVGFVIFRADTISSAFAIIAKMFAGFDFGKAETFNFVSLLTPWFLFVFVIALIGAWPLERLSKKISSLAFGEKRNEKSGARFRAAIYAASFVLLILCMIDLSGSTYNPFIYFRF